MITPPLPPTDPLVRFVTDGLLATIDSHRRGVLPLHRLDWELRTRIDTLAGLAPPTRTLTRLRWLQRTVERVSGAVSAAGRTEPSDDQRHHLVATLDSLRTVLAALTPRDPLDPTGAARVIAPRAAA